MAKDKKKMAKRENLKPVLVEDDTHGKLGLIRVKKKFRSLEESIKFLLNYYESREGKI